MPVTYIGGANSSPFFYDMILAEGLSVSLLSVLDAADTRSTDGTSQTWTDIVGTANWQRGTGAGADAADPTFTGTAGTADEGTYWALDGGDLFQNTTLTFQDPWIKDAGTGTVVFLVRTVASAGAQVFCCFDGGTNLMTFYQNASEFLVCTHVTTNLGATQVITGSNALTGSAWHMVGYSWDEAATTIDLWTDDTLETLTWNASTRTNNLSTTTCYIGTDGASYMVNGSRIAAAAFWNRKLSSTEYQALYDRTKAYRSTSLP